MKKLKVSKGLVTVLKIMLSASALAFVISKIDVPEVISIYRSSNLPFIFIALVLFALSKIIAASRLNVFLRNTGIILSERFNLKLYLLGMFYNLFLPGGIGGDGYKIYLLGKNSDVKTGRIFWAVLTDRVSGILALFCLAVLLTLFIDPDISFRYKSYIWVLIPLSIIISWFLLAKFLPWLLKGFAKTTILSVGVQVIQVFCALAIFLAIGGTENETEYLLIFLISSIVAMLPISIGGVGTRELTFLYGAKLLGLDQNISIAMSLMFYLITAFVSFWGIYYSVNTKVLEDNFTPRD